MYILSQETYINIDCSVSVMPFCSMHVSAGAIPITFSDFGGGDGLILLANVNCSGTEANLAECPHVGIAQFFCSHDEDSGVVCPG